MEQPQDTNGAAGAQSNFTAGLGIDDLVAGYREAVNALNAYRKKHGLEPGVKVVLRYRDGPEKKGTIAPYGDAWTGRSHIDVPVWMDDGFLQPWAMSDITVLTPIVELTGSALVLSPG